MLTENTATSAPIVWGELPDGTPVYRINLSAHGVNASFITYGAALADLRPESVEYSLVLGFDRLEGYVQDAGYVGVNVGRFANRIREAQLEIDGTLHRLDQNFLGRHTLHGGSDGAGVTNWDLVRKTNDTVTFGAVFADGHMGFPGRLAVNITYEIKRNSVIELRYGATTDAPTACNFAHHGIFNLSRDEPISDHVVQVFAPTYLPVDADLIPLGAPESVVGTRYDFQSPLLLSRNADVPPIDVIIVFLHGRQNYVKWRF
jgi:aldose 1-epimerase